MATGYWAGDVLSLVLSAIYGSFCFFFDRFGDFRLKLGFHLMMSTNIHNILGIRDDVHDTQAHHRLKYDLIENIWNKFGDS